MFRKQINWPFNARELGLATLTLLLFIVVASLYPEFATAATLKNSFDDTAILMLMALGQMGVILTRAIDLSVAANMALTGMCVALLNQAYPDAGIAWILLASLAMGALLGACNGLLIWLLRDSLHRRDAGHDGDLSRTRIRRLWRQVDHQQ